MSQSKEFICIKGILSDEALKTIKGNHSANSFWLFVSYSEYEIPVGATFVDAYDENGGFLFKVEAKLIKVTQEFDVELETIPKGWKTICLIEFTSGFELIQNYLEVVSGWFSSNKKIFLYRS